MRRHTLASCLIQKREDEWAALTSSKLMSISNAEKKREITNNWLIAAITSHV